MPNFQALKSPKFHFHEGLNDITRKKWRLNGLPLFINLF